MKGWSAIKKGMVLPPFKQFEIGLLPYGVRSQIRSAFFFTPLLQLKVPSEEFGASMRFLQRKRLINDDDLTYLTESVVH